jgi:hypothetical protein
MSVRKTFIMTGIVIIALVGFAYYFSITERLSLPFFRSLPSPTPAVPDLDTVKEEFYRQQYKEKYQNLIEIKNGRFEPPSITVVSGEALHFYTLDPVSYNIILLEPVPVLEPITLTFHNPTGGDGVGEYVFEKPGTHRLSYRLRDGSTATASLTVVVVPGKL